MRYRRLTSDNDYVFGNSQLDFFKDEPGGVGQAVMTRLLLFLGEWYLDISAGTPYFESILGKHSKDTADATIQQVALQTTDGQNNLAVTDITNYVSVIDPSIREMDVQFMIDTIYGPTAVQIANYANF